MAFSERSERLRQQLLKPGRFSYYLWTRLPLAAVAGLRLRSLDAASCVVTLPGGFRTQNPFRSTYFAAQCMAAEMSTGAPAMVLVSGAPVSVSMLVREVRASFSKKIVGTSTFSFEDVAGMSRAVDAAAATGEAQLYTARSVGRAATGEVAAEFDVTWTFKRRSP